MSTQGQKVLLVDDDNAIRTVLRDLLHFSGHDVIECADANDALAVLDRCAGSITLLIADYAIPGMNGLALARDVARMAPWIQTLIISGHRGPEKECRHTPGLSFLSKPFGTADLLKAMNRVSAARPKRARSAGISAAIQVAL
jgi:DNA-binding NtrC family response regulator